jgi:hypothetical protein
MKYTRSPYSFFGILHIALALICLYSVTDSLIRHVLNISGTICMNIIDLLVLDTHAIRRFNFYRKILTLLQQCNLIINAFTEYISFLSF